MVLTNLRIVRNLRGQSQRRLAATVGLYPGYVHLLEKGLPVREVEHVTKLAEALSVPAGMLSGPPLLQLPDAAPGGDAA